ncbi:hypothetical protein H5410_028162 [Solanum commersonii]|uniref:DUF4283 domain-containing protein n=1 Tax=Solanum commersonii TaxID=4109 RepID=A0A9J5Z6P1_SOLCO|nr:hypothetical protein H5410_028162 [Solanum commersonii]
MAMMAVGQPSPEEAGPTTISLTKEQLKKTYDIVGKRGGGSDDYQRRFTVCCDGKFFVWLAGYSRFTKTDPKQCEPKGEVNIGLLSNKYILIRASRSEDYDPCFDLAEETSTSIAWISFPALPPNFFGDEVLFSFAVAVGKPLQVDLSTQNKTRPSCERVKVEVEK